MGNFLIKTAVRTLFTLTGRERATDQITAQRNRYQKLLDGISEEDGRRPVQVPAMAGIDEDMRNWSLFMVIEHNRIVNQSITATVRQLVRGKALSGAAAIDPKTGVMPSPAAGTEQVPIFFDSIAEHVETVSGLENLRGSNTSRHPLFGDFDAHKWHCMFSFHLKIHYRQAEFIARTLFQQP